MAYRPDFYKVENIIGFTGDVNLDATVYFLVTLGGGPNQEYGHITQAHSFGRRVLNGGVVVESANVGREKVRTSSSYQMVADPGTGFLLEYDNQQLIHPSRHAFVPVASLQGAVLQKTKFLLSCAIARYTEMKECSDFTEEEADQVDKFGYIKKPTPIKIP